MAVAAEMALGDENGGELQKVAALLGGTRVLSRLTSALDAHDLLLHGLPASAIDHLVGNLIFIGKTESLEKAVGTSLRTWQRRKDAPSKPLSQEQSGRAGMEIRRNSREGNRCPGKARGSRAIAGASGDRAQSAAADRSLGNTRRRRTGRGPSSTA